eukprot:CAMPEP_0183347854 /NCGR_PEP_ID=MMETSP0164_2-20130417/12545_1 /TAXON_ID=221442 /ORGANISM="Coccolithus pelagicus ssp braarudi, Strain PLY182g" /LENGTH=37 /DNA_ID= /DNA_START= /DNA_END= /DNA_ORIENTATION=
MPSYAASRMAASASSAETMLVEAAQHEHDFAHGEFDM